MKQIQSPHNVHLKHLNKLMLSGKTRRQHQQTVLEGIHLLSAYQQTGQIPQHVYVSEQRLAHPEVATVLNTLPPERISVVATAALHKISLLNDADGLMTQIALPESTPLPQKGSCVVLENIQDAGNVGTILRSAAAAGIQHIILSKNCADVWSPKVLRAGMGAHFSLFLHERTDLHAWLAHYQGRSLATALRSERCFSLYQLDLRQDNAWIFGNEGSGVSAELLARADLAVRIPMTQAIESLNVAMAASICLFEQMRQTQHC